MTKMPLLVKISLLSSLNARLSTASSMATLSSVSFAACLFRFHAVRLNFRTKVPAVFTHQRPLGPFVDSTLRFASAESANWGKTRRRLSIVFASDSKPPEEQDASKKSGTSGQGPPFLTILAAVVVLLFILWIVGSVLLWLMGLIVNVPPRS